MYNAPYQGVANQLAGYGRYGDSMLVHMNPIEVQMLASLSPTGRLTDNPYTGQKEAFLPFLAPLLGSFLGQAALPTIIPALAGKTALAGAIGSGLATTAVTGDLEQGIMSGITGFGIGSALGASAGAGNELVKQATTDLATKEAAQAALSEQATKALTEAQLREAASSAALSTQGTMAANAPMLPGFTDQIAGAPEMLGNIPSITPALQDPNYLSALSAQNVGAQGVTEAQKALATAQANIPVTERLTSPFREPGAFFSGLTEPSSFLPVYVGESGRMAREQELMGRGSMRAYEEEQEAQRQKTLGDISGVYNRIRSAYPVGYAQGGQVEKYKAGAAIPNQQEQEINDLQGLVDQYNAINNLNIPDPKEVQLSLRGSEFVPPPAASYSALDVGGAGYLPGVAPEFQYFREPPPPPPTGYVPPPPGTIAGGGGPYGDFDFSGIDFSQFPQYQGDIVQPMVDSQQQMAAAPMPNIDFSSLYGGIGAFNQPEMPVVEQAALMPEEQRILAARELQVPISELSMDEMDDELNPFARSRNFRERRYGGGMMYAEGGMTEGDMTDRSIVEMTVAAIRGEVENADEIISRFLDMYGPEAFTELRDRVLKDIVPGAQTEGMIEGEGGGQDDLVEGMIGTQRPVAVSPGEYIIPADVVSLAGGGYSGDGAKYFDNLIEDIRMKTMGKTDQIKPYRRGGRS